MSPNPEGPIQSAEVVLPCADLDRTLAFFTDRLFFRIAAIFPADDPQVAVVAGHGLRIRLVRGGGGAPGELRLYCTNRAALGGSETELMAPNGTRIVLCEADSPLELPLLRPSFTVTRMADGRWGSGRAGMQYRDLVPDRQGGRYIASHIRIPEGGPVPDYVHFHRIRFQMLYCYRGWVRLVYEDQGDPFILKAGDCVLQPPRIRHRVLECSPGLEVIEVSCPAEHETHSDLTMHLPTGRHDAGRDFCGQRFVRHRGEGAVWESWRHPGFEARDLGIGSATDGLAGAQIVRCTGGAETPAADHDGEFRFSFVLEGSAELWSDARDPSGLAPGDAFVVPAGIKYALTGCSSDLELLEVNLPEATL